MDEVRPRRVDVDTSDSNPNVHSSDRALDARRSCPKIYREGVPGRVQMSRSLQVGPTLGVSSVVNPPTMTAIAH